MPFNLTTFVTATLVVRFYRRFSPRTIGVSAFTLATVALICLSFVVTNNRENLPTILGLIAFGIGQGALITLVFNVPVTSAPAEFARDVGSIRGSTQNFASAVGTAADSAITDSTAVQRQDPPSAMPHVRRHVDPLVVLERQSLLRVGEEQQCPDEQR